MGTRTKRSLRNFSVQQDVVEVFYRSADPSQVRTCKPLYHGSSEFLARTSPTRATSPTAVHEREKTRLLEVTAEVFVSGMAFFISSVPTLGVFQSRGGSGNFPCAVF